MPTLAQIQKQIAAYPHRYIFWTQKEIRALPEILDTNESVRAVTSGMMGGCTWLAVCTERRLIFLNRRMFFGLRQVQMMLDRVQSIDHDFTVFFGNIRVFDGVTVFMLNMVLKDSIMPFVKVTEEMIHAQRKQAQPKAAPSLQASADVAGQLAKLAELKEKGYLTEAEFQEQKKKLLSD